MKKTLFVLCLICVTFNCIAQRRNEWGQKMVKSITEVFWKENDYTLQTGETRHSKVTTEKTFSYDYDKNNRLSVFKVTEYCYDQDNEVLIPKTTKVFSKNKPNTPKGGIYDTFTFYFNNDGLITNISDFNGNLDGSCYGANITYVYDNNIRKPVQFKYQNFEKQHKGGNTTYSTESVNSSMYYKGIPMPSNYTEAQCEERAAFYDFTKPNDININIINSAVMKENCVNPYIEMTEWVNCRSDYMAKEGDKRNLVYTYDDRGNIVKATGNNGIVTFIITIEYVE